MQFFRTLRGINASILSVMETEMYSDKGGFTQAFRNLCVLRKPVRKVMAFLVLLHISQQTLSEEINSGAKDSLIFLHLPGKCKYESGMNAAGIHVNNGTRGKE